MKSESFILLLMIIWMIFAAIISNKYIKGQKELDDSQNRKIERIYEVLGLE